jgi:hypothetical protein
MRKKENTAGKYTIIAALIAAISTIIGIYLSHHLEDNNSSSEKLKNERQSDKPQNITIIGQEEFKNERQSDKQQNDTIIGQNKSVVNTSSSDYGNHSYILTLIVNSNFTSSKVYVNNKEVSFVSDNLLIKTIELPKLGIDYNIRLINEVGAVYERNIKFSSNNQKITLCDNRFFWNNYASTVKF